MDGVLRKLYERKAAAKARGDWVRMVGEAGFDNALPRLRGGWPHDICHATAPGVIPLSCKKRFLDRQRFDLLPVLQIFGQESLAARRECRGDDQRVVERELPAQAQIQRATVERRARTDLHLRRQHGIKVILRLGGRQPHASLGRDHVEAFLNHPEADAGVPRQQSVSYQALRHGPLAGSEPSTW